MQSKNFKVYIDTVTKTDELITNNTYQTVAGLSLSIQKPLFYDIADAVTSSVSFTEKYNFLGADNLHMLRHNLSKATMVIVDLLNEDRLELIKKCSNKRGVLQQRDTIFVFKSINVAPKYCEYVSSDPNKKVLIHNDSVIILDKSIDLKPKYQLYLNNRLLTERVVSLLPLRKIVCEETYLISDSLDQINLDLRATNCYIRKVSLEDQIFYPNSKTFSLKLK